LGRVDGLGGETGEEVGEFGHGGLSWRRPAIFAQRWPPWL
jgi:hypothetical protein